MRAVDLDKDGWRDLIAASDDPSGGVTWWRNAAWDASSWVRQDIDDDLAVAW